MLILTRKASLAAAGRGLLAIAILAMAGCRTVGTNEEPEPAAPMTLSESEAAADSTGQDGSGAVPDAPEMEAEEPPLQDVEIEEVQALSSDGATPETTGLLDVSGFVSARYRGRKRSGDNDEDIYAYLSLSGGREDRDDVSFHVFARGMLDLDDDTDASGNPFASLNDLGGQVDAHVYEAFVSLNRGAVGDAGLDRIRLGRQNIHAGFSYLMDGGRLDFKPIEEAGDLQISVFGGKPQYLYEQSRSGDWMAGIDASFMPGDSTRFDIRYVHVEDENDWVGGEEADDYASMTLRQKLGDNARGSVTWNTIDACTRDVLANLIWDFPEDELSVRLSYRFQDDITKEFTTPFDPYVGVLGASYAYHQFDVQLSKLFGETFAVDAGFSGRFLEDNDNEAAFNREFTRGYVTLSTRNWPAENVNVAVTGEYWESNSDQLGSFGGEIEWKPSNELRLTLGSFYSLYKYDLFVVDEREDATTIFLKARWRATDDLRLDARYEFETGDEGDFHTFTTGLTWTF